MIDKIKRLTLKIDDGCYTHKGIYTFINPYSYSVLRKTEILTDFDRVYIDGISLVKLFKIFNIKVVRKSFDMTSLAPLVFQECIKEGKSIYFIGSKESDIKAFIKVVKYQYQELNILGCRNGYFLDFKERQAVLKQIYDSKPDVVVCGMGTPYQEQFLLDLKNVGWQGAGYSCGGFIHQTAKGINYYPSFFNKFNIRWIYRIIDEPKLLKRYFVNYPLAMIVICKDLLAERLKSY